MAEFQKITACLWYDGRAQEAATFYASVFRNARVLSAAQIEGGPAEGGSIVSFELEGQEFTAVDGGPMHQFSPAISFVIKCESQDEIDHFWERLSEDGEQEMCGWVKDKFGVSWQIIPAALSELLSHPSKASAVMSALLTMRRIDIEQLQAAYCSA